MKNPSTVEQIIENCNISKYTAETLLEVASACGIVIKTGDKFANSLVAQHFCITKMTKVNFNFVKDVCYLGASELGESFVKEEPVGCHKFIGNYETIYNAAS